MSAPPTETTPARIKREAMALFVERGIDAVSVRDIAARVGMKPSNLYAHFRSREALIEQMFAEGYAAYSAELAVIADGPGDFPARLTAMIDCACRLFDTDGVRFRFLLLTQHMTLARLPAGLVSPVEIVQQAVTRAVAAGEIPARDPALLTAMILGIVLQAATFRLYGRLQTPLGAVAADLAAACVALIGGRAR